LVAIRLGETSDEAVQRGVDIGEFDRWAELCKLVRRLRDRFAAFTGSIIVRLFNIYASSSASTCEGCKKQNKKTADKHCSELTTKHSRRKHNKRW
jgi:hypothetical protein